MIPKNIPFQHFFIEVCQDIRNEDMKLLNPYRQSYFKIGNLYVALGIEGSTVTVEYAQNSAKNYCGDWQTALVQMIRENGATRLLLHTADSNRVVHNIAEKWKMKVIKTIPNYYTTGEGATLYELAIGEDNVNK